MYLEAIVSSWVTRDFIYDLVLNKTKGITRKKIDAYKDYIANNQSYGTKVIFEANADGRMVCNDILVNQMQTNVGRDKKHKISLETIVSVVCSELILDSGGLFSKGKNRALAAARAIIALCVQEFGTITLQQLAEIMHRDITTVSNSVTRLKGRVLKNQFLNSKVIEIINKIQK